MKRKRNIPEEERKKALDEFWDLETDIVIDQVKSAFRENKQNAHVAMKQIGFEYFDDDYGGDEEQEEDRAVPENADQETLVSYFNGDVELTAGLSELFFKEKQADNPNYPLFRRYFKRGNKYLKELLLLAIKTNPTDRGLLSDLSFFDIFQPALKELINAYTVACNLENDLQAFKSLADDFYCNTDKHEFDALSALKQMFDEGSEKREIINQLEARQAISNDLTGTNTTKTRNCH